MAKRRMGIIAFLFCLCLCLMPCDAYAASTADAAEFIDTDSSCSLTLKYHYADKNFEALDIKLYQVASVSADFQYSLCAPFLSSGLELNGVQTQTEWDVIRSTLESHILANQTEATQSAATNEAGQLSFEGLKPGLYLVSGVDVVEKDWSYIFDSALIALPGLGTDGVWQYELTVTSKSEAIPNIGGDGETEYRVLKLWKGDRYHSRPKSIEVEIFKDGESYKTVTLSEENNWSYSWTSQDEHANWMVVERYISEGYTVTVDKRETTFTVTNSYLPDPFEPTPPPKTGDSSNLLLYLGLMYTSGAALILLGVFSKRKRV